MAKMNSKFKYMLDAAPAITFRAPDAAAITADGAAGTVTLDKLDGYWNTEGELADTTFAVVVNVSALDTTTGDETYVLNLEAGPVGFATSLVVGRLTITEPGQYVILVDIDTVVKQKADTAALRLSADVGGTTPSITFGAFIGGAILR